MIGSLTNRFEIVLRPLRDKDGPRQTVFLSTRTAVQATREATARWPEMKVVSVSRVEDSVASFPTAPTVDVVAPLRRAGS